MEGVVIRSTGSWYEVLTDDGQIRTCTLKGVFRIRGLKATNPVAVGDRVVIEWVDTEKRGVIRQIHERRNYIIRKSTKLSKTVHILAANVDQLVIIATLAFPRTSTGFIDRLLVTAEAYKIPARIFFNKSDIYDERQLSIAGEIMQVYETIAYPCALVSAFTGENINLFKAALKDKTTLLAGHSGVGKSALINAIEPGLDIKTSKLSDFSRKGTHTTTFAEMHPLSFGGHIIDSPGIKEFGLVDFYKEELTHYFPELFALLKQCKYHNCTHTNEPDCAVRDAVHQGSISSFRYENYLNMYHGQNE